MRQVLCRHLEPYGLTPQEFRILMAVADQDGRCHGDLARLTWMDKPTTTRVLRSLQDRGLVKGEPDPGHGRRILFCLRPEAGPLIEQLQRLRKGLREDMERGLDAEDRQRLRAILGGVMTNLDRMELALLDPSQDS